MSRVTRERQVSQYRMGPAGGDGIGGMTQDFFNESKILRHARPIRKSMRCRMREYLSGTSCPYEASHNPKQLLVQCSKYIIKRVYQYQLHEAMYVSWIPYRIMGVEEKTGAGDVYQIKHLIHRPTKHDTRMPPETGPTANEAEHREDRYKPSMRVVKSARRRDRRQGQSRALLRRSLALGPLGAVCIEEERAKGQPASRCRAARRERLNQAAKRGAWRCALTPKPREMGHSLSSYKGQAYITEEEVHNYRARRHAKANPGDDGSAE